MCSYRICRSIVSRSLNWREMMYVHITRDNNDTARVLPCGAFYTSATIYKTVDISIALFNAFFVKEFFYITISSFISYSGDRSCTEKIIFAE